MSNVYTHTCIRTYMYIHTHKVSYQYITLHTSMHPCTHAFMRACRHARMRACTRACHRQHAIFARSFSLSLSLSLSFSLSLSLLLSLSLCASPSLSRRFPACLSVFLICLSAYHMARKARLSQQNLRPPPAPPSLDLLAETRYIGFQGNKALRREVQTCSPDTTSSRPT